MTLVLDAVGALRLRANRRWWEIQAAVPFQSHRHTLHHTDDLQFLKGRTHTFKRQAQTPSPLPGSRLYLCAFVPIQPEADAEALPGTLFGRRGSDSEDLVTPRRDQAAARHDRHGFGQGGFRAAVQAESKWKVPTVLDDCCTVGQNTEGWKHLGREKHRVHGA